MIGAEANKLSQGAENHARMMRELNRLIAIIFDEPEEQVQSTKQEAEK